MLRLKSASLAFEYIRRNPLLTLTNLLVMTLTFFITSVFALVIITSHISLKELEQRPQISAYFKDDATESEIMAIKQKLEGTGLTSSVEYISKEQALKNFMGLSQKDPALLEGISANVLPASLEVKAKNLNDLPVLASDLEKESSLEELQYFRDVVEKFRRLSDMIRFVGFALITTLSVISLLIVLITIAVTVASRGEEIEIMRLVGATDWQIRGPFLFQGAILGLLSAVLALLFTFILLPIAIPRANEALSSIPIPQIDVLTTLLLIGGELLLGVFVGSVGSMLALRKYLRI